MENELIDLVCAFLMAPRMARSSNRRNSETMEIKSELNLRKVRPCKVVGTPKVNVRVRVLPIEATL